MKKILIPIIILIVMIAALTVSALFLGFGISFGFPMELNCEKYDVEVCKCMGFTYDNRTECVGVRTFCDLMVDGCRQPEPPTTNNSNINTNTEEYTVITACENREHGANASDRFMIECESDEYCKLQIGTCLQCANDIPTCVPVEENPTTRHGCLAANGDWGFHSAEIQEKRCNLPTSDGGEKCSDGSECDAGYCWAIETDELTEKMNSNEHFTVQGECPYWMIFKGGIPVENGRVKGYLIE